MRAHNGRVIESRLKVTAGVELPVDRPRLLPPIATNLSVVGGGPRESPSTIHRSIRESPSVDPSVKSSSLARGPR